MKKIKLNSELFLLIALVLIAAGIIFIIKSDFGMTVVQAPVYILSIGAPVFSMGVWNYIVQGLLTAVMIIVVRRFKISYVISFLSAVVYGLILDLLMKWMGGLTANTLPMRILFYFIGYVLLCLAVSIFFTCKAPLMPYDLFIREIAECRKISITKFKWIYDIACVLTAVILSLILMKKINGIGIGTLIFALTVSPVVGLIIKVINKYIIFVPLFKDKEFLFKKNR